MKLGDLPVGTQLMVRDNPMGGISFTGPAVEVDVERKSVTIRVDGTETLLVCPLSQFTVVVPVTA